MKYRFRMLLFRVLHKFEAAASYPNSGESHISMLFISETPKSLHFEICLFERTKNNQEGMYEDRSSRYILVVFDLPTTLPLLPLLCK